MNGRETPIEIILLRDDVELEPEPLEERLNDDAAGPVDRGEDNAKRVLRAHEFKVEDERLEAREVSVIDFAIERGHAAPLFVRRGRVRRVHFRDDAAGVRLDHLRAVVEVNLVAVVVRRVVARGDDYARARVQVAHRKGEFRRRTRPIENAGVATVFGRDVRRQSGEFTREKTRVVGDHEPRQTLDLFAREPFVEVIDEALGGAPDALVVHHVRPHAGELRTPEFVRLAALRLSHDLPDGAPADSAGAEGEGAIKAVVQFVPFPGGDQFRDRLLRDRRSRRGEGGAQVLRTGFQESAGRHGLRDFRFHVSHVRHFSGPGRECKRARFTDREPDRRRAASPRHQMMPARPGRQLRVRLCRYDRRCAP